MTAIHIRQVLEVLQTMNEYNVGRNSAVDQSIDCRVNLEPMLVLVGRNTQLS